MGNPALFLIDKTPGITSFDCIRVLKRVAKRTDFGHGGTLDKFATGLLPVFVGEGLKLARFLLESYPSLPTYWKTYRGEIQLGISTETGDPEGGVTDTRSIPALDEGRITDAMGSFVGKQYLQTPPAYSAKKIEGQRAGQLARLGQKPELKPVPVEIRSFSCLEWNASRGAIRFDAVVSKGTYIRVLAEDLARRLETVAHVTELRRTAVGTWDVGRAVPMDKLGGATGGDPLAEFALDLTAAAEFLPTFPLLLPELDLLSVGKVDGILARLANSGLAANAYLAVAGESRGGHRGTGPLALLELAKDGKARFLRAFAARP